MAIIRDKDLIPDLEDIPVKLLRGCIQEHQKTIPRLKNLEDYYLGKHKILTRVLGDSAGLPNNQLVGNHAKYITDIAVGYVTGNPVKYEGKQIEPITETYKKIDIVSHDSELAKDISIFGYGLELYYMTSDDNTIPDVAVIDPRNIFLVVDDTVEYRSLFGVHYYPKFDLDNNTDGYNVHVYTAKGVTRYFVKDLDSENYEKKETKEHYWNAVPIVEFWNNEEQQGDFEQQISLIDAYNVLQSDRVNDKEQLVDAILMLKGVSLGDSEEESTETARILKRHKLLELPSDGDASWLVKQLNEQEVEVLRKAIRDDIHQFAMVPNLTDENFAAQSSGVAMKYKLLGLEQLAKNKERYFVQGLRERLQLFANALEKKAKAVDISDVEITMTRNLPVNDLETSSMIANLDGKVSAETLIAQLSFVDDVAAEIKAVAKQEEETIKRNQKAFGMPMGEDVKDNEDEE